MSSQVKVSQVWLAGLALLTALAGAPAQASVVFSVTVATGSLSGTNGILDLQFNPGGVTSQAATALVTSFTGGTLGSVVPPVIGPVTGTLPTDDLLFQNSANTDYAHQILFANTFQFLVTFDGDALTAPNNGPAGTTFGLFLFDSGFTNPLITVDGLLAQIDINPDGSITATGFGTTTIQEVTGVPEPSTLMSMVLAGCLLTLVRNTRARKNRSRP